MKERRPILKNRVFLYLTEFFSGMSVMAVELGASRLLAPYFSSSQIVWTIIIGTIMIAMALGNIYGGRSADKNPNPDRLYTRIIISAIWIALIPVVGKYIIIGISAVLIMAVNSNFLIIAGFAACMVIFVFPLFLLGTVTPSLAKFTVENLEDNGKLVGNLNAFNTVGSIIGTFVPTFISIPAVGTSVTFLIFAGILLTLAIVYFVSGKPSNFIKAPKIPISIILFLVCVLLGRNNSFAFWQDNLTYEGESIYNYLQVYEDDDRVVFSTNVLFGVQSVYMKEKGFTGFYYDYAMAAPYMAGINEKDDLSILILGNGTGTYATQCERYFDNVSITGVEIDQSITDLAKEYFDLPEDVEVITYDGRAYLNAIDEKYDVIMVDAYQDITIPFQMSSIEFFTLVKEHLKDDGVMVVNMNMRGEDSDDNITAYLSDTISQVFSERYLINSGGSNREFFASNNPDMLERCDQNVEKEDDPSLLYLMGIVKNNMQKYEPGDKLMTDDKAPVELLGMKEIDLIIQSEVRFYKDIYETEGLKGVLERL